MSAIKADAIAAQLMANAAELRYGSVAVFAKLHEGRVVSVSFTTTKHTREQEIENEKKQE